MAARKSKSNKVQTAQSLLKHWRRSKKEKQIK